jgi:hypothetical protein
MPPKPGEPGKVADEPLIARRVGDSSGGTRLGTFVPEVRRAERSRATAGAVPLGSRTQSGLRGGQSSTGGM